MTSPDDMTASLDAVDLLIALATMRTTCIDHADNCCREWCVDCQAAERAREEKTAAARDALAALAVLRRAVEERDDRRESLAQEFRGGLRVRGLWAPDEPADLITATFKALDGARAELDAEVAALRAENERLRADLEHSTANAGGDSCADYALRNEALRAEVSELREEANVLRANLKGACRSTEEWREKYYILHSRYQALETRMEAGKECPGCITEGAPVENGSGEWLHPDAGYCEAGWIYDDRGYCQKVLPEEHWSPAPRTETREAGA